MELKLKKGDKVLVFDNDTPKIIYPDGSRPYVEGTVVGYEKSSNLSLCGKPRYEYIYTVKDEKGKVYTGTYREGTIGNAYYMTRADYIESLKHLKELNIKEVEKAKAEMKRRNDRIEEVINELEEKVPQYSKKRNLTVFASEKLKGQKQY